MSTYYRESLEADFDEHTEQIAALEAETARLRTLLAAAERLIMAHHTSQPRQRKGAICQVCAGEHEAVQAIWKELHET